MSDTITKDFAVVIHYPFREGGTQVDIKKSVDELVPFLFSSYAYIVHDKDVEDDGMPKPIHIHLVGISAKRTRLSTMVNVISSRLAIARECVSVMPCLNFHHAIRYLTHMDNPEKFQYDNKGVVSSADGFYEKYVIADIDSLTADDLIAVIQESDGDYVKICRAIGLKAFNTYNRSIWSLINGINDNKRRNQNGG